MLPLPVGALLASTLRRFGVSAQIVHFATPGTLDPTTLGVSGQSVQTIAATVLEAGIDDIKDLGFEGEIHFNDRAFTLPVDWAGPGTAVRLGHRDKIVVGGVSFVVMGPSHAIQAGGNQVGAWIVIARAAGQGAIAGVVVTVPPTDVAHGAAITPAVVVTVEDEAGQTIASPTFPVTVALTPGTGTPNAVLSGTLTRTTVNGVATFADLAIDLVGTGYTLTVTSPGLVSAISVAFAVS